MGNQKSQPQKNPTTAPSTGIRIDTHIALKNGATHDANATQTKFIDRINNLIELGQVPARRQSVQFTFYTVFDGAHEDVILTFKKDNKTRSLKFGLGATHQSQYALFCCETIREYADDNIFKSAKSKWHKKKSIETTIQEIIDAANDVITKFGAYNTILHNCQDFVIEFL